MVAYFRRIGAAEWEIRKSAEANARHWSALQTAIRHGVKIAMGTDMLPGEMNEGTVATYREMEFMAEAGLTSMQVLMAATRVAAEVMHAEDQFGTLEPGKFADIVACDGNPAEQTRALRNTRFVMQRGRVIRFDQQV